MRSMRGSTDFVAELHDLTEREPHNWRKLLQLGETWELEQRRQVLWAWPSEEGLLKLTAALAHFKICNILSIGCGNGLLEWLLKESNGIEVNGLEIDSAWWQSAYAARSFIQLNFIDAALLSSSKGTTHLLKACARSNDWQFALLFCYFNNRPAFVNYLRNFEGEWVLIIGPAPHMGIHTDPSPFDVEAFEEIGAATWKLEQMLELSNDNVMVFYRKFKSKGDI